MLFFNQYRKYMLMDKAGDEGGGGGNPPPSNDPGAGNPPPKNDPAPGNVVMTQAQFDALMAKIDGKGQPPKNDDPDLMEKARLEREAKDKQNSDARGLESALRFTMGSGDWLKENSSLLPKDVEGIFQAAEKENYDSTIQKASAIKSGIVQSFFNVQENMDLLTAAQKQSVDEFLKLTKNGKEEKAQQVYDSIFEPTFEMKKRISKAQQLQRDGSRPESDSENAYKDKLMKLSQQHYMGVKSDA